MSNFNPTRAAELAAELESGISRLHRETAEQLRAAISEVERLSAVNEQWELDYATAMADVRNRTRERDELRAEVERMRAVVREAALYCSQYGEDASSLDTALERLFGAPIDAIVESARDTESARLAIDSALKERDE